MPLRDIRPYVDALYFDPATVDVSIITRFTTRNSNLDKPCTVILHCPMFKPWPKLFQNMRASCETDWLKEGIPAHVVAAWVGHSVKVWRQSYAQITDGHFDKFNTSKPSTEPASESGSICASDDVGTDEKRRERGSDLAQPRPNKNADDQRFCTRNERARVAVEGLEIVPKTLGKQLF